MLRHRPTASSATGILPEGCLMTLYVLENQGFPPAPLLRVSPLPGHCAPKCWAIFQQLALSTGMHISLCPTFASVIVMLLSAYSHTGSREFFPQPYSGSLIATVKLFYNRFCYQEWIFLFYHYPNPNYPSKAFLYNIQFAVLSVGSGIVVHFEI